MHMHLHLHLTYRFPDKRCCMAMHLLRAALAHLTCQAVDPVAGPDNNEYLLILGSGLPACTACAAITAATILPVLLILPPAGALCR